jgi:glycyl-tRNA synthetase beta subunit
MAAASVQRIAGTPGTLREPVDAFFEAVMVNAEDAKVRANRYAPWRVCAGCSSASLTFRCWGKTV